MPEPLPPFQIGDRAYCIHSREWGEILEFRTGGRVTICLEESGQSIRLLQQLMAEQLSLPNSIEGFSPVSVTRSCFSTLHN